MTSSSPAAPEVTAALDEVADPGRLAARFAHPDKYPTVERAALSAETEDRLAAELAHIPLETWRGFRDDFRAQVRASVELIDPGYAPRLPFVAGDRIVALGDSITDDSLSWAAHLQTYLDVHLPDARIEVVNAGITGNTTQEAISRIDILIAARPTWVIQLLGTNDARLHGHTRARMQSIEETRRNMALLGELITVEAGARLVRLTPPPVVAKDADVWDGFQEQRITWREADIAEIADAVRQSPGEVVDVHQALSDALPTEPWLLLPDGVHPSLAGQRRLTEIVLTALSRG